MTQSSASKNSTRAEALARIALDKCADIVYRHINSRKKPKPGLDGRYHYVYLTINKHNYHFYVGKHTSSIVNDKYIGSGGLLTQAIEREGRDSFELIILGFYETAHDATIAEAKIVDQDFLRRYGDELGLIYNERPARTSNLQIIKMVDPNGRLHDVPNKEVKRRIAGGWLLKLQTVTITNPKLAPKKDKLPRMAYTKTVHLTTANRNVHTSHLILLDYLRNGWVIGTVNSLNPLMVQSPHRKKTK